MANEDTCSLCGLNPTPHHMLGNMDWYRVTCQRCGEYRASFEFVMWRNESSVRDNRHIFSALSRELNETGLEKPQFVYEKIDDLLKHYLIPKNDDIDAKIGKLLQRIKEKTKIFGNSCEINVAMDYPLAYAANTDEFLAIIKLSKELKYIRSNFDTEGYSGGKFPVSLTAEGWKEAVRLKRSSNQVAQQGFVAIWFDPEGSMDESTRAIEAAITATGFNPLCIRHEHFSERIMDKALGEIRRSRFLVADLTGSRPSVFFEAGFANGLDIQAIYVYRKGEEKENETLDFYTKHYQCHPYESAQQLQEIVENAIRARYKSPKS